MIFAQSAHLEQVSGGEGDADVRRAGFVRRTLAAEPVAPAEG
jgi:hypothetical protein